MRRTLAAAIAATLGATASSAGAVMLNPLPLPQVRMPVVVPSLWSTGSPPVQLNCCGLSACLNRGAVGAPSRIAKPPFLSRSSEKVLCSPQCTQSRVPSAVRFTVDGTAPALIVIAPGSAGGTAALLVGVGAGDDDESDGEGVVSGIRPWLAEVEGSVTSPSA